MPDQNRRTILPREHALGRGYRFGQRCQRVLHRGDIEACCLQACDHLRPRRPVGEQSVHQDDVSGNRRRRCSGVRVSDESACRARSHHAHKSASIHWLPHVWSCSLLGLSRLLGYENAGNNVAVRNIAP